MPPKGTINLHGSLLPQYRGAAPINWAIINGEEKTGVTTFFIEEEIDTGGILLKDEVTIGKDMSAGQLHDKLADIGAQTVVRTIEGIDAGSLTPTPQSGIADTLQLKAAPKIFKEDCLIDWTKPAQEVHNFIRGTKPISWSALYTL